MKLKHSAIVALALWLCVVAWVSAMVVAKPTAFSGYSADEDSAVAAQLQQNINHNRDMQAALVALANTGGSLRSTPVVAPDSETVPGLDGLAAGEAGPGGHVVTMVISTDRARRAVVDGQLVRRGSRLRNGSLVSAIGADWVRVEDIAGRSATVHVQGPFSAAPAAPGVMEVRR